MLLGATHGARTYVCSTCPSPRPFAFHRQQEQSPLGPPTLLCLCVCVCVWEGSHACWGAHVGAQGHLTFLAEPLGQWELCAQSPRELTCVCVGDKGPLSHSLPPVLAQGPDACELAWPSDPHSSRSVSHATSGEHTWSPQVWEGPRHPKALPPPTPGLPRSARLQQMRGLASVCQKLPSSPGRAGPCTGRRGLPRWHAVPCPHLLLGPHLGSCSV